MKQIKFFFYFILIHIVYSLHKFKTSQNNREIPNAIGLEKVQSEVQEILRNLNLMEDLVHRAMTLLREFIRRRDENQRVGQRGRIRINRNHQQENGNTHRNNNNRNNNRRGRRRNIQNRNLNQDGNSN